jgi:hypothetical protein
MVLGEIAHSLLVEKALNDGAETIVGKMNNRLKGKRWRKFFKRSCWQA